MYTYYNAIIINEIKESIHMFERTNAIAYFSSVQFTNDDVTRSYERAQLIKINDNVRSDTPTKVIEDIVMIHVPRSKESVMIHVPRSVGERNDTRTKEQGERNARTKKQGEGVSKWRLAPHKTRVVDCFCSPVYIAPADPGC